MATQSLTIQLGLAGLAKVTAGLGQMKNAGVKAAAGIEGAFAAIGGLTGIISAVVGGVMARSLSAGIDRMDAMSKAAQKLGDSAENVSALAYAAKLSDVEMESLQTSLKTLNEWYAKTGQSAGSLREELLQQADVFSNMADGPAKAALAVDRFGRAGLDMLPMLNQGRAGIVALEEEARRLGITVSSESAASAEELNDALTRLKATTEGLVNKVAIGLAPALRQLANGLTYISGALSSNGSFEILGKGLSRMLEFSSKITWGPLIAGSVVFAELFKKMKDGASILDALRSAVEAGQIAYQNFVAAFASGGKKIEAAKDGLDEFVAAMGDLERMQQLLSQRFNGQIAAVSGDATLTEFEKRARLRELNQRAMDSLVERERMLQARAPKDSTREDAAGMRYNEEALKFEQESLQLAQERATLMNQQSQLGLSEKAMQWEGAKVQMRNFFDEFTNMAAAAAQGLQSVFTTSINAISSGISGLILGTMTWGKMLANIGTTILTSIVEAIVGLGVRWVATQILMATAGKAIAAASVASTVPLAAAQSVVWAGPATLATIATAGGAAAAAPGLIASSQGLVMAQALAGFQSGGYTGDGAPNAMAGIVHRGEFVFDAPAVDRIGVDRLESLRSGDLRPISQPGATGGGSGTQINLAAFDSRQDARKWSESQNSETWFVDMANRTARKVRRTF